MKYHEYDNLQLYKDMKDKNLTARYEVYDGEGFDVIVKNHELIELLKIVDLKPSSSVLVRGTGTGADSCIVASQGHTVTGVDLIPDAIQQARINTAKLGYNIKYLVDNVCNMVNDYPKYDVIIDSYFLQSIVASADRATVYDFVKSHLKADGKYLLISAGYSDTKDYSSDIVDRTTGIVLSKTKHSELSDTVNINGETYVPTRRHYTVEQLEAELIATGLKVTKVFTITEFGGLCAICGI